jgi:hypothetical protein
MYCPLRIFRWKHTRRVDNPCDSLAIHVPFYVGSEAKTYYSPLASNLMHGEPEVASDPIHPPVKRLLHRIIGAMGQ